MDKYNNVEDILGRKKALRILRIFSDTDLRCGHVGLRVIAKEHQIDTWRLDAGEFLVFLNARKTKLKLYTPGNGVFSWQHPAGHRIDLNLIRYIPRFFNGTEFKFEGAFKEMMDRKAA